MREAASSASSRSGTQRTRAASVRLSSRTSVSVALASGRFGVSQLLLAPGDLAKLLDKVFGRFQHERSLLVVEQVGVAIVLGHDERRQQHVVVKAHERRIFEMLMRELQRLVIVERQQPLVHALAGESGG